MQWMAWDSLSGPCRARVFFTPRFSENENGVSASSESG